MKITLEWEIGEACVLSDTVEGLYELIGVTESGRPIVCDKMFRDNKFITSWSLLSKPQENVR